MRAHITIMTTLSIVAIARAAAADEHLTEVSEVLLAEDGDDSIQYIELTNPGETFPEEYQLTVYDAAGDLVGIVPIDVPPGMTRYLVATPDAEEVFGVTADAPLTETLPAEGQVCFEALEEGETEVISCLDWGCSENLVVPMFANGHGRAPASGMSLQLQGSGAYHVASPTPDDDNVPGDATDASCVPDDDDDGNDDGNDDGDSSSDDGGGGCAAAGSRSGGLGALFLALAIAHLRRRRR